jgi:hypothetical protein
MENRADFLFHGHYADIIEDVQNYAYGKQVGSLSFLSLRYMNFNKSSFALDYFLIREKTRASETGAASPPRIHIRYSRSLEYAPGPTYVRVREGTHVETHLQRLRNFPLVTFFFPWLLFVLSDSSWLLGRT